MVYINLLPIRQIKARVKAYRQMALFALCFAGVLAAIGSFWFYQLTIEKNLNSEIASLKDETQRYAKILEQIAQLEKDKQLIESKIAVINELQKTKALTVRVLDEIAKLTPSQRMWITSLKQDGMKVNLSGTALDNQTIANYMEALKTSPYISDVSLGNTSLTTYAGLKLKAFTLSCDLVIPENNQEETAESGNKQQ